MEREKKKKNWQRTSQSGRNQGMIVMNGPLIMVIVKGTFLKNLKKKKKSGEEVEIFLKEREK